MQFSIKNVKNPPPHPHPSKLCKTPKHLSFKFPIISVDNPPPLPPPKVGVFCAFYKKIYIVLNFKPINTAKTPKITP